MKVARRLLLYVVLFSIAMLAIHQAYWQGCQDGYYLRVQADDSFDRDETK